MQRTALLLQQQINVWLSNTESFLLILYIKIQQMSYSAFKPSEAYFTSVPQASYFRNAFHIPRPATTAKNRKSSSQKHKSIDYFSQNYDSMQKKQGETEEKRKKLLLEARNTCKNSITKQQYLILENLKNTINKLENLVNSTNELMKNIVKEQIISYISLHDPLMRRLNRNLVESIFLIGKLKRYEDEEAISKLEGQVGFILYGRVKIFNKDYKIILDRGDTLGEHVLFKMQIQLKARCLQDSCILWLPVKYYIMLRQQSIKNGLKSQVNKLQVMLRLSLIKKKLKQVSKKAHI